MFLLVELPEKSCVNIALPTMLVNDSASLIPHGLPWNHHISRINSFEAKHESSLAKKNELRGNGLTAEKFH
ncbi:MAG: hypothetical protein KAS66_09560 [Candidatus Omnitrophica bacterium]|nr:hypothetical protein [Candidatus Omnitrophota bacterium]